MNLIILVKNPNLSSKQISSLTVEIFKHVNRV